MNATLVEKLVAKKMENLASGLRAEGWAWVEIKPEMDWHAMRGYGRVFPVEAERSDAENHELGKLREEQEHIETVIDCDEGLEARLAAIWFRSSEIDREAYAPADL
ncbi:chromosome partitioning protein, ParB family [Ensifer sp. YR511]|nr:chromosome partitioning protein, ParB family [Ensifer sp. YR511]